MLDVGVSLPRIWSFIGILYLLTVLLNITTYWSARVAGPLQGMKTYL
jgi:hypothetical protein